MKVSSGGGLREGTRSLCDIGLEAGLGNGTGTAGILDNCSATGRLENQEVI